MRRKILVVAVLFCLLLSLTACGGEKSIEKKVNKVATVTIEGKK